MSEPLFMGIDGGGSKLRIIIADAALNELSSLTADSVNPSIVGRQLARKRIRRGIVDAVSRAKSQAEEISAVGIGIAGASNLHSEVWLFETLKPILPDSRLVLSSDMEIALVGALAQRHGILLLAGTGSAAFGATPDGRRLQVGGWGYLLGDEGSSFWIGSQLLKHVVQTFDSGSDGGMTTLSRAYVEELGLPGPRALVGWVYRSAAGPVAQIASLAPLVLNRAADGDGLATDILSRAANHLVDQVATARRRLSFAEAPIAFAGGLLDNDNWLTRELALRLDLPERPAPKHPPVMGAVLLAKMEWSALQRP